MSSKKEGRTKLSIIGNISREVREDRLYKAINQSKWDEENKRQAEINDQIRKEGAKPTGLRGKFIEYLQNPNLTVDEAIEKFTKEHPAFSRDMVRKWMMEDLDSNRMPKELIPKVKEHLSPKVKERADDDAR